MPNPSERPPPFSLYKTVLDYYEDTSHQKLLAGAPHVFDAFKDLPILEKWNQSNVVRALRHRIESRRRLLRAKVPFHEMARRSGAAVHDARILEMDPAVIHCEGGGTLITCVVDCGGGALIVTLTQIRTFMGRYTLPPPLLHSALHPCSAKHSALIAQRGNVYRLTAHA